MGAVSRLEQLLAALWAGPDSANITDLMPGLSKSPRDLKSKPQRNSLLPLLRYGGVN